MDRVARILYDLALWVATPLVVAHLIYRGRRQPDYFHHWGQRFGFYGRVTTAKDCIWIHAVSVGETRAAQPLVAGLESMASVGSILLTHMTPTGREVGQDLFANRVTQVYLPYDYPGAVARFLDHFRPRLAILMETEVWPNLIAACERRGIPVVLVNARLSEKSLRSALRWHVILGPAIKQISLVLAQTTEDASRITRLGARHVEVVGNVKFDTTAPPAQLALAQRFRQWFGDRPVIVAASTREREEALLLEALHHAHLPSGTLLVIVPRHPQRFGEVERMIAAHGYVMQRRSENTPVRAESQIWLGDSMGEMFAYYDSADLSYVGGGLLPYGTHNLIEACAVGCPILLGPHTFNFEQAAADAIAAGAALRVSDAGELMTVATRLLSDRPTRLAMSDSGRRFASAHRGASQRTLASLEDLLANVSARGVR